MDTIQTNRVTMFKTVDVVLDEHNAVWSGMPRMQTAVTQLKSNIIGIDRAAQLQETPSGAADDKDAAREALEDILFLVCEALALLAQSDNDHDLLALVALKPSNLQRFETEELSNRAANVLSEANSRKTALAGLNTTQASLDELDQALQNFNASKTSPRTATTSKKVQTATLAGLIRETSNLLRNEIDRLVNLYRRTNPEFVAAYRAARIIVDRGKRHAGPKTPSGE